MYIQFMSDKTEVESISSYVGPGVDYTEGPKERFITFSVDDEGANLLKRIVALIGYTYHLGTRRDQAITTDQESESEK